MFVAGLHRSQVMHASFITLSVLLNIFFVGSWIWPSLISRNNVHEEVTCFHERSERQLEAEPSVSGWSRRAAEAAEMAALFNCSGNGDLYVDSNHSRSLRCECYECFTGPRCADLVPNCDANVESGDPLLFAPFWKQNAEESAVLIPGWYRMGYEVIEGVESILSPALEREIRTLHTLVGNAIVDNRYIIPGVGSQQLLNALVASLSPSTHGNAPASVVTAVPYYASYRDQTEMFETSHYDWEGDANLYAKQEGTFHELSIEFVTSPNNPDGAIRRAVLNGSATSTIYDLAYYWPHYTAITSAHDYDVMLFTLSKITGHAGSRIGWAIVKDYSVYTRVLNYVQTNVITVAHEPQLRATQVLSSINKAYSRQIQLQQKVALSMPPSYYARRGLSFHYAYAILRYRWNKISSTLGQSQRLSLQKMEPNYCNFFKQVTGPSPAYAWVHCKQDNEKECQSLFINAGIKGRNGKMYGASNRYIRFSLLKRDSVFENLVVRLSAIV